MRTQRLIILLAVLLLTLSTARADRYTLGRYTLDADATVSSSSRYTLSGLTGQKETGMTIAGYQLIGGFWTPGSVCVVNLEDFAALAAHWLDKSCDTSKDNCGGADLDGDNSIGLADLQILAETWLNICPSAWPLLIR